MGASPTAHAWDVDVPIAESVVKVLNQGLLGVASVIEGYVIWRLYSAKEAESREHRLEVAALLERHIVKAENFAEKQTAIAAGVTAIMDRLTAATSAQALARAERAAKSLNPTEDR